VTYSAVVRQSARRHENQLGEQNWKLRLPCGFFFLCHESTGLPIEPVYHFLTANQLSRNLAAKLISRPNTSKAVAYDIRDFVDFLDAVKKKIEDVDADVFEQYLGTMNGVVSAATGETFLPSTITRRASSVRSLLKHCQDAGLIKNRFDVSLVETPSGSKEVILNNIPLPETGPIDRVIRAVDPRALAPFMYALGPEPVVVLDGIVALPGTTTRQRLMSELSLQAGLRREEACNLPRAVIFEADTEGRNLLTSVAIPVVGKGQKVRQVPVVVWLLQALKQYITDVRDPILQEAISKGWRDHDHGLLFVLETARKGALGSSVTPHQSSREFAKTRELLRQTLRNNQSKKTLFLRFNASRLTIHALRHTFALTTYIARKRDGDPEPSKYIQSVLGHSFRETTEAMYLRSSHVYESELSEAMELQMKDILRVG